MTNEERDLNQQQVESAWTETLKHFGIHRPVLPFEKMHISRLIKAYDWKSVLYAVTGMRWEQKTQSFDPKHYIGLRRLDNPELFERFLNTACIRMKKESGN